MVGNSVKIEPIPSGEARPDLNYIVKGVIIGPKYAGKSSLLHRFESDQFNSTYTQTIGIDFCVKCFRTGDGEVIKTQMWDTAGTEQYRSISNSYFRGAYGIMIVFDLQDLSSFQDVPSYITEAMQFTLKGTPIIIVGNKSDVGDEREVTKEEAETFAKENDLLYLETSAKNNDNVSDAFEVFIDKMVQRQKQYRLEMNLKPMAKGLDKQLNKGSSSSNAGMNSSGQKKSKSCAIL